MIAKFVDFLTLLNNFYGANLDAQSAALTMVFYDFDLWHINLLKNKFGANLQSADYCDD